MKARNRPRGFGPPRVKVLYSCGNGGVIELSELHSELAARFAAWDEEGLRLAPPHRPGRERIAVRPLYDGERELYAAIGDPLAPDQRWMCVSEHGAKPLTDARRRALIAQCHDVQYLPP
jgi:hypothetical protein